MSLIIRGIYLSDELSTQVDCYFLHHLCLYTEGIVGICWGVSSRFQSGIGGSRNNQYSCWGTRFSKLPTLLLYLCKSALSSSFFQLFS